MTFEDYGKKKKKIGANLTILYSFKHGHLGIFLLIHLPLRTVRTNPEVRQAIPYTKQAYLNPVETANDRLPADAEGLLNPQSGHLLALDSFTGLFGHAGVHFPAHAWRHP